MAKMIRLTHGDHAYGLRLESAGPDVILKAELDGQPIPDTRAVVRVHERWLLIQIDGRTHRCLSLRDKEGVWVSVDGRARHLRQAVSGGGTSTVGVATDTEVRAPMTGTLQRIEVKPGDRVAPGDLLAVMEAMKMEYRLEAQMQGRVDRVLCKPGDLLDLGALLIELAPDSPA